MTTLLDTHVLHWWTAEPERLSRAAAGALEEADELAVSGISWYELAWLARHGKITLSVPVRSWLERLAENVRTVSISPAIAETAAALPEPFPGDPADRLIFATAMEFGWKLVTKDNKLRSYGGGPTVTVW
ncbi:MAG TPA: type II toxin-antitoxin system VapC family toxin [Actinomycetota bacterium]|nr:type II toxin-antitoxin system VapC family toxin [Actinomycetota bacterium]